ncbi:phosphatase PAP2 family protein [Microbacteriaceae bacterium 4G12]
MTNWFIFLSYIGSIKIYVLISLLLAGYFLIRRRFWISALLVVMLQGSHYINAILKIWYERQRPDIKTLVTATGYSFPSGHAMNAMSFLSFIAYVTITEHRLTLWQKIIVIFFTIFLILFIGISRIYLGVHYPSDVVAGFAAGGSWVVLCILFHRYFRTTAK